MTAERVARIREAAELVRTRAAFAPDGPWTSDLRDDGRSWVRFADPGDDVSMHGYPAAAEHIAGLDPTVALAVADWMVYEAAKASLGWVTQSDLALAVADAYLDREVGRRGVLPL